MRYNPSSFSTGSDDISVGGESFPHSEDDKPDMQDDAEEEAWLNALETGGVNERGYLPQKKDPTSLTARQVHMLREQVILAIINAKELGERGEFHWPCLLFIFVSGCCYVK